MPHKSYDPLAVIPSPAVLRRRLTETLTLAERLRVLLEVSERLRLAANAADRRPAPNTNEPKGGRPND